MQNANGSLKAADAAPHLGGEPDMLSKHLGKSTFAYAYGARALCDGQAFFPEQMHRLIDKFRTSCTGPQMSGKESVEGLELPDRSRGLAEAINQIIARPHILQADRALKE
jgi:hypothetical protein